MIRRSFRNAVVTGFLVGIFVGAGATAAYAVINYTGWSTYTTGTSYSTRAYLTDTGGGFGGIHNKRTDGAVSPAGYLGGKPSIWLNGALCNTTGVVYNGSAVALHIVQVPKACAAGNYTASGTAYAYKPSTGTYVTRATGMTPVLFIP